MDNAKRIEQLKAELAKLEAEQSQVPVRKNELGYYAIQTCKNNLENIKLVAKNIDLTDNSEAEIVASFNQINKASWTALKSIERDATERGE